MCGQLSRTAPGWQVGGGVAEVGPVGQGLRGGDGEGGGEQGLGGTGAGKGQAGESSLSMKFRGRG